MSHAGKFTHRVLQGALPIILWTKRFMPAKSSDRRAYFCRTPLDDGKQCNSTTKMSVLLSVSRKHHFLRFPRDCLRKVEHQDKVDF